MNPTPHAPQATVSVVICAYTDRRWEDLLAAVASLRRQTLPPLETIVVIDHNSELAQQALRELAAATVVENAETQGLSGARNTGVRIARGDVIAFLDDDAVADDEWLEQLIRPYADPSVMAVGGTIDPLWPGSRPPMLPAEFDWVVGCTYAGMPSDTTRVRNVIGANMSLRRSVFDVVGGFRTDVGRVGTLPLGCEETELCIRVRQLMPGSQVIFEPRARVGHRVTADRTRWRYFRSRCYAEGLSKAVVSRHAGREDGLESERAYATRTLPRGVLRGIGDALFRGQVAGLLRATVIVGGLTWTVAGYAVGTARTRRARPDERPT